MATITVTGHIFDPTGTAINNGTVAFRVSNYLTIPRITGSNILVPIEIDVKSNAAGFFTVNLQGNDTITPKNTIYEVDFGDGEWICYSFTGAGPINLDSFAPCSSKAAAVVGGGATVTSVGLALPSSVFSVSGSPVTSAGTLTGSFINQTANTVFAGPASGAAGVPNFRTLVVSDIPVGTDGLIHGDSVWPLDPAYLWMRDDFLQPSIPSGAGILYSELEWFIVATGGQQEQAFSPSPIPNAAGTLLFNQSNLATNSWFLTPQLVNNTSNLTNGLPLFDYPNWKSVWIFSLARPGFTGSSGSTPAIAFSTAQTSFYIGLANWVNQTMVTTNPSRPPTFIGLRYDTDPVGAPASVQTHGASYNDGGGGAVSTFTNSFQNPNSPGNFLVLFARVPFVTIGTVTDSAGNTWQKAFTFPVTLAGNTAHYELWYAENCKAGANTVTMTTSDGTNAFWQTIVAEYQGVQTSGTLQQTNHATGVGQTNIDSGPITTTATNTLVLGVFANETANTAAPTVGTGWTQETTKDGNLMLESRIPTSTGTFDATGSYNQSVTWGAGVAAFKAQAPLADSQFVFEAVQNGTTGNYLTVKNRTQGNTFATGKTPAENTWYRLEILCTVAGQALVSLFDGVSTVSTTLTMPKYNQGLFASLILSQLNGIGTANVQNATFPYAGGSKITISGVTNATYTSFNATWNISQFFLASSIANFYKSGGSITQSSAIDGSISGYGGVYPYVAFGNDGTANPVASRAALLIDFFSLVWNPAVGGGTGTPTTNKARYW